MTNNLTRGCKLASETTVKVYAMHLFAQEVADLKLAAAVLNNTVDWEMGVYGAHLILEAL